MEFRLFQVANLIALVVCRREEAIHSVELDLFILCLTLALILGAVVSLHVQGGLQFAHHHPDEGIAALGVAF